MNKFVANYVSGINRAIYEELCGASYLCTKKLNIIKESNSLVIPPKNPKLGKEANPSGALFGSGGVVDEDGLYVELSGQIAKNMKQRVGEVPRYDGEYKTVHEKVIYMNFFIKQWGHYLLDVVGRLWYALEDSKTKIVYTCYQGEKEEITGNYLELLELLGIDRKRLVMINEPTKFDEVIIPESAILPGEYYTKEYKRIFDTVVQNAKIEPMIEGKKVYCSRTKLDKASKSEFGEEIIEKNLNDNGYLSVYMEKMTLTEQIRLLNSAECIAMLSGSLSHNLLFVRNQNKTFIFNKTYRVNLHQFLINEISSSKCYFIDIFVSPLPVLYGYGPFIVRATKEFEDFAKDNEVEVKHSKKRVPLLLRMKYYIIYLWRYKRFIIERKKIQETSNKKFEPSFKLIRKYYKEYISHV